MSRHADLALALGLAVVGGLVALALPGPLGLRAALVAPLVFLLPGYALTAALFSLPLPVPLAWTEWLLMSGGLSLVAIVLSAIGLNLTPWGLTATTWVIALFGITLVGLAVAGLRRARAEAEAIPPLLASDLRQYGRRPVGSLANVGLLVGALVVAGGAVWLARLPVPEQPVQGFTLLWSLPNDQSARTIRVGVQSFEPAETAYDLKIAANGQTLQDFNLNLSPVQAWEADVTLPPGASGDVEALLYRTESPDVVYRRTLLRGGG